MVQRRLSDHKMVNPMYQGKDIPRLGIINETIFSSEPNHQPIDIDFSRSDPEISIAASFATYCGDINHVNKET